MMDKQLDKGDGDKNHMGKKTLRRKQLFELLGDLPDTQGPVVARTLSSTEHDSYIMEHLELDLNGIEAAPAYFIRPKKSDGKPFPVVLFNHSHGGIYEIGKDELLRDKGYLQLPNYAEFL